MAIALDTNVLVYAERADDPVRRDQALDLTRLLAPDLVLPIQVLGEFHRVLRRKLRLPNAVVVDTLRGWEALVGQLLPTTTQAFHDGVELAGRHGLDIYDAIILSVAAEARCTLLLSEDMQDGFVWHGTTVANPFASNSHPLLASALVEARSS